MAQSVTAIILAGGESRRMGQNKAFLPWGNTTLINQVIDALHPVADEIIIVSKQSSDFVNLSVKTVEDLIPDAHALGGLFTGLRASLDNVCFVCACDMPYLNTKLIQYLCDQISDCDAVIPSTSRGLQPLHAVYTKSLLPTIKDQINSKQWSLQEMVPKLNAKLISNAIVSKYDPTERSFINLNTQEDYLLASK